MVSACLTSVLNPKIIGSPNSAYSSDDRYTKRYSHEPMLYWVIENGRAQGSGTTGVLPLPYFAPRIITNSIAKIARLPNHAIVLRQSVCAVDSQALKPERQFA